MKTYYYSSEGQMIFDRTFALVPFIWGLLVKALIYCPLWLTGYIIARAALPSNAKGYYWVGCIVGVAAVLYCLLFVLKGIIIALKYRRHRGWILLLIPVMVYTCVPPGMVAFHLLRGWIAYPWVIWALSAGAGLWAYSRYHFLVDLVPARMWGLYSVGLRAGGYKPNRIGRN